MTTRDPCSSCVSIIFPIKRQPAAINCANCACSTRWYSFVAPASHQNQHTHQLRRHCGVWTCRDVRFNANCLRWAARTSNARLHRGIRPRNALACWPFVPKGRCRHCGCNANSPVISAPATLHAAAGVRLIYNGIQMRDRAAGVRRHNCY